MKTEIVQTISDTAITGRNRRSRPVKPAVHLQYLMQSGAKWCKTGVCGARVTARGAPGCGWIPAGGTPAGRGDPLAGQKHAERSRRRSQTAGGRGSRHRIHLFVNPSTRYMKEWGKLSERVYLSFEHLTASSEHLAIELRTFDSELRTFGYITRNCRTSEISTGNA